MVITYQCPSCGGGLKFDPKTQKYKCEFCFSLFSQQELEEMAKEQMEKEQEEDEIEEAVEKESEIERQTGTVREDTVKSHSGAADVEEEPAAVLYQCPSCGAQIVTDETTAATFCYYCHNPIVLSGRVSGTFQPDTVIPFQIDKKKAETVFMEWVEKKRFIPNDFFSKQQIEKLSGIYFPYWLYNCEVHGDMQAEGIQTRVWRSGDLQYTETKRYDVSRSGVMKIRNVARNALQKADKELIEGVLPYQMEAEKTFSNAYLTGFGAEKRDMERTAFQDEIKREVEDYAEADLKAQAGANYNQIRVLNRDMRVRDEEWKYVLLPVWLVTYQDKKRDKVYYFALNGQTGKMCGELPVDYKKLSILFVSIFIPLLIFFMIGGYLI